MLGRSAIEPTRIYRSAAGAAHAGIRNRMRLIQGANVFLCISPLSKRRKAGICKNSGFWLQSRKLRFKNRLLEKIVHTVLGSMPKLGKEA